MVWHCVYRRAKNPKHVIDEEAGQKDGAWQKKGEEKRKKGGGTGGENGNKEGNKKWK